jgi:hypothetical protein
MYEMVNKQLPTSPKKGDSKDILGKESDQQLK